MAEEQEAVYSFGQAGEEEEEEVELEKELSWAAWSRKLQWAELKSQEEVEGAWGGQVCFRCHSNFQHLIGILRIILN